MVQRKEAGKENKHQFQESGLSVWTTGWFQWKEKTSLCASHSDHNFFIFTSGRGMSRSILPSSGVTKWQTGFDLFSTSGVWKITQV